MIVLGIHDGHNASACLMVDGKLEAMVEEERFSRLKMDCGYPIEAVDFCLAKFSLHPSEVDQVAVATQNYHALYMGFKMNAMMTIDDWVEYNEQYFRPLLYEGKKNNDFLESLFSREKFKNVKHWYDFSDIDKDYEFARDSNLVRNIRIEGISRHLKIDREKITFFDHHNCHAHYSMFAAPGRKDGTTVFTLDGGGDASVSTVSRFHDGQLTELARTNETDIARMYRYVTLYMGMKSGQHEHKVMGLAPYATDREVKRSWAFFEDRFEIRNDLIRYKKNRKPKDLFFTMQKEFRCHRFDGVAGAVQQMVEEVVGNWISEVALAYGSDTVRFGGGVAMNVKLNMLLNQNIQLEKLYICPSPTDNTLSIGACYASCLMSGLSCDQLEPVNDVYLGPRYTSEDVNNEIRKSNITGKFVVEGEITPERIAQWLVEGKVVARFSGGMEFGERALGNRSILADPRDIGTVAKINEKIKYRDFWMPFAPVILEEVASDYIVESENLGVFNHMMIATNSTPVGRDALTAGIHPADKTMRPQVIKKSHNQEYWEIVNAFKKITGVGALINTSFNLHGEPIVGTPADAISTFERSELDVVVMENRALLRC